MERENEMRLGNLIKRQAKSRIRGCLIDDLEFTYRNAFDGVRRCGMIDLDELEEYIFSIINARKGKSL